MREPEIIPWSGPGEGLLRAADALGPAPALSAEETRWLFDLGRAVASGQDLPRIFRAAMDAISAIVRADDAFLFVTDDFPAAATPALRACLHSVPPRAGLREHDLIPACVEAAQQALRAPWNESNAPSPHREHGLALEVVPLSRGGQALGCLVAARDGAGVPPEPFDTADRQRLRWVGDALVMALDAAEMAVRQQHHAREILLLTDVGADSAALGLDRFMPAVTERIGRSLHFDLAELYFVDPHRDELVWSCGWQPEGRPEGRTGPMVQRLPARPFGGTFRARQARRFTLDDLPDPAWRRAFERRGLTEFAIVPMVAKDSPIGILLAGRADRPVSDDDLRLLVALSVQVAVVADNTRLLAEAHRRAADLALVQRIGSTMSSTLSATSVLKSAIAALRVSLDCDIVRVYRRRGTVFESLMYRGPKLAPVDEWGAIEESHPAIARFLAAGRAQEMLTEDIPEPTGSMIRRATLESFAVIPLLLPAADGSGASASIGLVTVGRRSRRRFESSELAMLDAVAGQLTIALRNAELYEETRRRAEDLTVIHEAGLALLDGSSLEATVDRAAVEIARLLDVRACVLFLVDHERRELVGRTTPPIEGLGEVRIPLDSNAMAARAARERRPIENRDLEGHPFFQGRDFGWKPRWLTALPFGTTEQVLGVMILVGEDPRRRLKPAELDRVLALGNQVALAIDRARLMGRLSESLVKLEETQKELIRRERLAALGGLAAVVAHEVRNPLGVISNSLGHLAKVANLTGDAGRVFQLIREESDRINQIVNDMLDYTRPYEPRPEPADLERVVRDAVASANAAERSPGAHHDAILTITEIDAGLPLIPMDDRQIHQVFVNLLVNAYQSLNGAGTVRVEARALAGGGVRLSVSDDGPGMTEETRARLFEPFFTTKAKGSGLGLAIVRRIVEGHGWTISVQSAPSAGTTFAIEIPAGRPSGPGKGLSAAGV